MSNQAKAERAKRLERWAETAMFALLKQDPPMRGSSVVDSAWNYAVWMEDRRSYTLESLIDLEPQSPTKRKREE